MTSEVYMVSPDVSMVSSGHDKRKSIDDQDVNMGDVNMVTPVPDKKKKNGDEDVNMVSPAPDDTLMTPEVNMGALDVDMVTPVPDKKTINGDEDVSMVSPNVSMVSTGYDKISSIGDDTFNNEEIQSTPHEAMLSSSHKSTNEEDIVTEDILASEYSVFSMPRPLRRMFAIIMVFCECANIRSLWDKHFESLAEDYRRTTNKTNVLEQMVLLDISNHLTSMGKDIRNYGLPELHVSDEQRTRDHYRELTEEQNLGFHEEDLKIVNTLNAEQRAGYDEILEHILKGKGRVFFVDGPGGTGKTYLYRALLAKVRSMDLIAVATATSGIAASIMYGGRTAHSRFKIPIKLDDNTMCNFTKQSGTAQLLRRASLIIWDEVAMTKRQAVEALDRTLQDMMDCTEPFGGKVMLFGGDFRQVLPVVSRGTRAQITNATLLKSYLWESVRRIRLTQNMRAQSDKWFADYLLRIGNGTEETFVGDYVQLPDGIMIETPEGEEGSIDKLIDRVFPNLNANCTSAAYMRERAILSSRNEHVDAVNALMIERFPGEKKVYYSFDSVEDSPKNNYPLDFLNSITPNGLPPHELTIKKNCPIILLRNLDPHNGLCNGTRLIVRGFQNNAIDAEIVHGQHAGTRVFLPWIPLSPSEDLTLPFKFKRTQFPIRLSFAMTINKAQVKRYLTWVYTFLSRFLLRGRCMWHCREVFLEKRRGSLQKKNSNIDPTGKGTKNIVYRDVLEY